MRTWLSNVLRAVIWDAGRHYSAVSRQMHRDPTRSWALIRPGSVARARLGESADKEDRLPHLFLFDDVLVGRHIGRLGPFLDDHEDFAVGPTKQPFVVDEAGNLGASSIVATVAQTSLAVAARAVLL